MGGKKDYENLLLAAMVHDMGKFRQGTSEYGKHERSISKNKVIG